MVPSLVFLALLLSFFNDLTSVHGHGHLVESFTSFADFRINQNGVNECGLVTLDAIKHAMNLTTPVPVVPGTTRMFQYQITNADGAGPLTVTFDETGVGNAFRKRGAVTRQVQGNNGNSNIPGQTAPVMDFVNVTIPADLTCSGARQICIMQVRQPQAFGSCVFVTTAPPPPPPPPPSPPAPATLPVVNNPRPIPAGSPSAADASSPFGSAFGLSLNGQQVFGQVSDNFGSAFSRFFRPQRR